MFNEIKPAKDMAQPSTNKDWKGIARKLCEIIEGSEDAASLDQTIKKFLMGYSREERKIIINTIYNDDDSEADQITPFLLLIGSQFTEIARAWLEVDLVDLKYIQRGLKLADSEDKNLIRDLKIAYLTQAACSGKIAVMKLALVQGVTVDERNCRGLTALMYAVDAGDLPMVRYLVVKRKANIFAINKKGKTVLQYATSQEVIDFLNEQIWKDNLFIAIAKALKKQGRDIDKELKKYGIVFQPELSAVEKLKLLCECYLEKNEEKRAQFYKPGEKVQGRHAIEGEMLCVMLNIKLRIKWIRPEETCEYLVTAGGVKEITNDTSPVQGDVIHLIYQHTWYRPVTDMTNYQAAEIPQPLLSGLSTPIPTAAISTPTDEKLIQKSADELISIIRNEPKEVVLQKVEAFFVKNEKDKRFKKEDRPAIINSFQSGCPPEQSVSAFMWAVSRGYEEVAVYLKNNGADVNKKNSQGYTILMAAAGRGKLHSVIFLVEKCGADITITDDNNRKSALELTTDSKVSNYLKGKLSPISSVAAVTTAAIHFDEQKAAEVLRKMGGLVISVSDSSPDAVSDPAPSVTQALPVLKAS